MCSKGTPFLRIQSTTIGEKVCYNQERWLQSKGKEMSMPKPVQASSYTFRDIIEGGFLYVDKTRTIYDLVRYSKGVYFLARPRRFGKSLLISTLAEIFQGNQKLLEPV